MTPAETVELQSGLAKSIDATAFGVKNVSASFGRQIAKSAILAIIVSLLLIVGYISVRFQWQFALPVMIALAHDIILTVGVYALVGREVTISTVAAVLTVLGYSIYDTIIIFDRIRENIPLMKRGSFRSIANVSLWETIPRSLATTFITLLPIASLLVFGGDTLKDFAFALLIGIASGAYSSIFIAAPLLAWFKEREPEYARRKDENLVGVQTVGGTLLADVPAAAADPSPAPPLRSRHPGARRPRRPLRAVRPLGEARAPAGPPLLAAARARTVGDGPCLAAGEAV